MKDIRQNANITGIGNIYSVVQCAVECIRKARDCVGFNFQITDCETYFAIFQDKHYYVGLGKWKASAKTQISPELGIYVPWFSVESNASEKRVIVWDSISIVDLLSYVNSPGCPTMLPLRIWRPIQPGIIMLSYHNPNHYDDDGRSFFSFDTSKRMRKCHAWQLSTKPSFYIIWLLHLLRSNLFWPWLWHYLSVMLTWYMMWWGVIWYYIIYCMYVYLNIYIST